MGCSASANQRDDLGLSAVPVSEKNVRPAEVPAAQEEHEQAQNVRTATDLKDGNSKGAEPPKQTNKKPDNSEAEKGAVLKPERSSNNSAEKGNLQKLERNSKSNNSAEIKTIEDLNAMTDAIDETSSAVKHMPAEIEPYAEAYPIIGELCRQLDEWERKTKHENFADRSPVRSNNSSRPTTPGMSTTVTPQKGRSNSRSRGERSERPDRDAVVSLTSVSTHLEYEYQGSQSYAEAASYNAGLDTPKRPGSPMSQRRPGSPSVMSKTTCNLIHDMADDSSSRATPTGIQELFVRILGDPSKNETCPWTVRCKAMAAIREICCDTKTVKPEEFQWLFSAVVGSVLLQLTDRRSQVCRMFCAEIGAIVAKRRAYFLPFASGVLKPLCALTKVTKKVMADSAAKLAFRIVTDVKDDANHTIFKALKQACKDKARHVRREALKMIQQGLNVHYSAGHIQGTEAADEHLGQILSIVKDGLDDSDAKARAEAIRVLVALTRAAKRNSVQGLEPMSPPSPGTPCAEDCGDTIRTAESSDKKNDETCKSTYGTAFGVITKFTQNMPSILLRKYENSMNGVDTDTPVSSPLESPHSNRSLSINSPKKKGIQRPRARKPRANGATPGVKSSSRRARSAMSSKKGPSRMKDFLKQKRKEAKKLGAIDMAVTVAVGSSQEPQQEPRREGRVSIEKINSEPAGPTAISSNGHSVDVPEKPGVLAS